MSWILQFLNSSIGKKFIMAITGSFLIIFLVIHLIGNLTLFFGPEAFNGYVLSLAKIKPLIRIIELVLLLVFIFHIYNGVRLWWENKKARPISYKVNGSVENTTIFSRTMFISGSIIFIFLVLHLGTFFWRFNVHDPMNYSNNHEYYKIVTHFFQYWWYVGIYLIAMVLLGFHLNHGFQSAFQTFGLNNKKYTPLINRLGTIYAIIMAVGFASIPIYFFLTGGSK